MAAIRGVGPYAIYFYESSCHVHNFYISRKIFSGLGKVCFIIIIIKPGL